ncbi:MATE family efflux transporter [Williamwhitmania taraxaci]|uniref:Multidrug export protein MepA n=1 Tax=Williamwhitmania taraxaci TaxID=1640674 RepID=A0A1G6NEB0_9BACT|nr:MATE family efflux transporter [Williamwhitmania taraxaci]SDC65617.1 putative efflux protein, MATE family [Williamwhitmania taraxaci]
MAKKGNTNDLGVERLGKLLLQYSVPAIIATTAASLYNIIDRIFIGQGIGPMAISGLALTFPLMNILAAFGAMVGVGAGTMVSIRLGQHDRKGATLVLGNALMLNIILSIVVALVTYIYLNPILYSLGASKDTLPYAREFMQVILLGNIFTHIYLGLNGIMRASGYPRKAMYTTLVTVGINLALAPLFIFSFNWGIRGAAMATVFAQIVGTVWVIYHFSKGESFVHFLPGYMRLKRRIIEDIVSIGMSNFLMLISASIVISFINISLRKHGGDFAIGAYGIIGSIGNLAVMVVIGFNQGMQPIVGYNYGANQMPRVIRTFKLTILAGTIVTCFGFLLAELFPHLIASAFTTNKELIDMAANGMRLTLMMFPIVGFQVVTSSFFQSIGKAKISIFLSLTRQLLFLIPALYFLPRYWGLNGVWLSGPVADFTSSLLTMVVLWWQLDKLKRGEFHLKKR